MTLPKRNDSTSVPTKGETSPIGGRRPLPPSLREVAARRVDGGSYLSSERNSPSHGLRRASPLGEGAETPPVCTCVQPHRFIVQLPPAIDDLIRFAPLKEGAEGCALLVEGGAPKALTCQFCHCEEAVRHGNLSYRRLRQGRKERFLQPQAASE